MPGGEPGIKEATNSLGGTSFHKGTGGMAAWSSPKRITRGAEVGDGP